MKAFLAGIVVILLLLVSGVFVVSHFGLFPIGADNPPGALERSLASRAMDVYADKHKPDVNNPTELTPANLTEGAKAYEEHCAFCHGGAKAKISPMQNQFSPPVPQLVNRVPHDPDNWILERRHVGRGDMEGGRVHQAQRQAAARRGRRLAEAGRDAGRDRGAHPRTARRPRPMNARRAYCGSSDEM
jgi:mono/diheme cytochrome c family protein